jgi:phosphotransferase system IIB component
MAQFDAFKFLSDNQGQVNKLTGGSDSKLLKLASQSFEYMNKTALAVEAVNAALKRQTSLYNKIKLFNKVIVDNSRNYNKLKEKEKSYERILAEAKKEQLKYSKDNTELGKLANKLLEKKIKGTEKELLLTKMQYKLQGNSIPFLRNNRKLSEYVLKNYEGISNSLGSTMTILKGLGSIFVDVVGVMFKPFTKGFEFFNEFQKTAGNIAADIGLTSNESFKLKSNFYDAYISASLLGGSMQDVATAITTYSDSIGKNRIFDSNELSKIIELGLGTKIGVQGASELASEFSKIGFSLESIIKSTDKARNVAAKLNLNSTKVLTTYQGLVKSLTGFEFKSGLENLVKLAAKATALRFDLSAMQSVSDKLFDPEGAVEAAAKISVLGGKFAQNFSDPFGLMYAAQNAPEMLFDNMIKSVQGIAKKNANGSFFISPSDRKIVSEFASAMGVDAKNLFDTAIEQAKIVDKMSAISSKGINTTLFSEEDRIAISNLIETKNGKYTIKLSDGSEKLLSQLTTKTQFDQILKERKKNEEAAIGRKSLMERLSMIGDRFFAGFSKFFDKFLGGNKFDRFLGQVEKVGAKLGDIIGSLFQTDGDLFKSFDNFINKGSSVLNEISKIFSDPSKSFGQKIGEGFSKLVAQMKEPMIDLFSKVLKNLIPLLKIPIIETLRLLENIPVIGGMFKNKRINMTKDAVSGDSQMNRVMQQIYGTADQQEGTSMFGSTTSLGIHGLNALVSNSGKLGKNGAKFAEHFAGKWLAKKLPILGAVISSIEAIDNFSNGNYVRGTANLGSGIASFFPGIGTAIATGLDASTTGYDMYEQYAKPVNDLVISKHGAFQTNKGDLLMAIHEDGFKKQNNSGSSNEVIHTGVITIRSENGAQITVDMLEAMKYNIIPTLLNQMESHKNGHLTHNTKSVPISPI